MHHHSQHSLSLTVHRLEVAAPRQASVTVHHTPRPIRDARHLHTGPIHHMDFPHYFEALGDRESTTCPSEAAARAMRVGCARNSHGTLTSYFAFRRSLHPPHTLRNMSKMSKTYGEMGRWVMRDGWGIGSRRTHHAPNPRFRVPGNAASPLAEFHPSYPFPQHIRIPLLQIRAFHAYIRRYVRSTSLHALPRPSRTQIRF